MGTGLKHILIIALTGIAALCTAQQPDDPPEVPARDSTPSRSLLSRDFADTVSPQVYTTPLDFYHLRTVPGDSLNYLTHQYDPARRELIHYGTLGNLGSAHRRHVFRPDITKGLDFGYHQYDLYKRRFADFKFYDSETPITEFSYSQGILQLDGILKAKFGKTFAKGIKLSIDYQRINQTGEFQNQRAKNTALGVGIWYDAPKGRYDGLYHYSSNSIVAQDNGGVLDYQDVFELPDPVTVPVNLTTALTTHRERIITAQNHFHLYDSNDSISRKYLVDIIHTGHFKNGLIKFYDEFADRSSDYYGEFITDDRGIRNYLFFNSIDNRVDLQFRVADDERSDIPKHLLRAGLQYRHTYLEQEPLERRIDEVFLNASSRISFTSFLDLRANGFLALIGQEGDFQLQGSLRYSTRKFGRVIAHAGVYQRSPNILERDLYISQRLFWSNDFNKPVYSNLGLELDFDALRLHVYGGLQVIGNHIYYDENRLPVQAAEAQDVWQIVASKEISVGNIGLLVTAAFQEAPDFLRLPTWIGEAQVYYTDYWFNDNLQVRTGIDLRITDSYDAVNYFPVTGQFYFEDQLRIDQYPALDVFFDMQVRETFRAFFKMENFSAFFIDDIYAHVATYPQFRSYFRFGIWMKLFN